LAASVATPVGIGYAPAVEQKPKPKEDDVLRRLLATPPDPRVKKQKPKREKQARK